jgi:hypothetical protein
LYRFLSKGFFVGDIIAQITGKIKGGERNSTIGFGNGKLRFRGGVEVDVQNVSVGTGLRTVLK